MLLLPPCFIEFLFLANLHLNRMIASCAIGNGALLLACLYLACPICGSCHNGILAREDWLPLPCPQNPGILGKGRVQFRDVPGYAAINTYLYFLYAAISCKGKTTDFNVLAEWDMTAWSINASDSVQRSVIPALVSVQTTNKMISQFDTCQPFRILF